MKLFMLSFLFLESVQVASLQEPCRKVDSCRCTFSDSHIDLTPLAGVSGPKWRDQYDQFYNNRFSYNPCLSFSEGTCSNVAVCEMNNAMQYFTAGTQETAMYLYDATTSLLAVEYNSTDTIGLTRYSRVLLNCITSGPDILQIQGEGATGHYGFKLSSTHCCRKPGALPAGGGAHFKVGLVLIIGFSACCLTIFLVAGFCYCCRPRSKAQGQGRNQDIRFEEFAGNNYSTFN
ncbi:uncharacterized protein LOC131958023 isoform X2 [Physella acuta]|uniref:uncharacterized protein LOC131958023 isoform X1 n=1 Tax=Physella acuta TaxID=109671 RepID=UPI0027DD591B|nr:uncharacterized protein LOC131958023 isoform X1 [Physella acuta]XP_059178892.1 uncharacterized protein LOC131958023 isoform X2 [Physella acuta]